MLQLCFALLDLLANHQEERGKIRKTRTGVIQKYPRIGSLITGVTDHLETPILLSTLTNNEPAALTVTCTYTHT